MAIDPPPRYHTWLCAFWVVAVVSALCFFEASDGDLGFHLATGRAILSTGSFPSHNVLSFAEPEHAWVLHQGWPALLFELAYAAWGIAGVLAIKTLVVALTFLLVFATQRVMNVAPVAASLATIFAAFACAPRFVERPLLFPNLAFAATLLCLSILSTTARSKRGVTVALVVVLALACHLHAGAVFSFIIVLAHGAGELWDGWRNLSEREARWSRARWALSSAGIGLALAAITLALYHPYGARVLLFPFQMASDSYLGEHLIEFRSPWRFPFEAMRGYWILLFVTFISIVARMRKLPTATVLIATGFALISLRHARFCDLFAIATVAILASSLGALQTPRSKRLIPVLLVLCGIITPLDHWSRYAPRIGFATHVWPMSLFDVVRRERLQGPAYVSDGWAGPWLGFFYPEERAFFHPAFEAYSPSFVKDKYMAFRYGKPGAMKILDEYGVNLCVLRYTSENERAYQHGKPNGRQLLARDPDWALIAFNDEGEIFARRTSANQRAVQQREIPGVDPDRFQIFRNSDETRRALQRLLELGPQSERAHVLLNLSNRSSQ